MTDRTRRRAGCGCLPLIALFMIGSLVALVLGDVGSSVVAGGFLALLIPIVVVTALIAAFLRRRRLEEREDAHSAGQPASSVPRAAGSQTLPRPPDTPSRSAREVRSGPRGLVTEPESEEARILKRRLTEAVSDLADNVEGMPLSGQPLRGLTSEEMIARAKQRIADMGSERDG